MRSLARLAALWATGVALPFLYYIARSRRPFDWLWPLPGAARPAWVAMAAVAALAVGGAWLEARRPSARRAIAVAMCALLLVAALPLHVANGPLGDAPIWVGLAQSPFIMGSEPLGRWSHYLAFQFTRPNNLRALELASLAAGVLSLSSLALVAPRALPRLPVALSTVGVAVSTVAIFYARYLETTPFTYAFTTLYLLAALRFLELRLERAPWIESLLLSLAVWTHGMACFVTGAHAVLLGVWLARRRWRPLAIAQATAWGLFVFVPLAATLAWAHRYGSGLRQSPWFGNAFGGPDGRNFVAPGEIATLRFWSERANLLLLMCPTLPLMGPALWSLGRRAPAKAGMLGAAFAGTLGMALFYGCDYGVFRDLDLLCLFVVPAGLIVLSWTEGLEARSLRVTVAAMSAATVGCVLAPYLRWG